MKHFILLSIVLLSFSGCKSKDGNTSPAAPTPPSQNKPDYSASLNDLKIRLEAYDAKLTEYEGCLKEHGLDASECIPLAESLNQFDVSLKK